jgi:hypothetical protein
VATADVNANGMPVYFSSIDREIAQMHQDLLFAGKRGMLVNGRPA